MIVEMIARQVGEGRRRNRQPFGAILGKAMARSLQRGMGDALALQARHVGEEGHDVRRGDRKSHTSELQSPMRISYAVFCLKKKNSTTHAETDHPLDTRPIPQTNDD